LDLKEMLMKSEIKTVVIARPGHYRTSLVALLATVPQVNYVRTYDELNQVTDVPKEFYPDLVLMETYHLNQHLADSMTKIALRWPGARRILLADRVDQPKRASMYGADFVLTKEISAGEFLRLIQQLIAHLPSNTNSRQYS
jgi:DNA-binding NarL/FixJ family response regulator